MKLFQVTADMAFLGDSTVKNPLANTGDVGSISGLPTPVFLPEKSQGQGCLVGYSPWSHKRAGHDSVSKQKQQHSRYRI